MKNYHQMYIGDFNGDGKDDVAGAKNFVQDRLQWNVMVANNTGNGFDDVGKWMTSWATTTHEFAVGDFTGDGKDDVMSAKDFGNGLIYYAMRSDGLQFENAGMWYGGMTTIPTTGGTAVSFQKTASAVFPTNAVSQDILSVIFLICPLTSLKIGKCEESTCQKSPNMRQHV